MGGGLPTILRSAMGVAHGRVKMGRQNQPATSCGSVRVP